MTVPDDPSLPSYDGMRFDLAARLRTGLERLEAKAAERPDRKREVPDWWRENHPRARRHGFRYRVAVHEAGHAIVRWALGGRVLLLACDGATAKVPGRPTHYPGVVRYRDSGPFLQERLVALAGDVAEQTYCGSSWKRESKVALADLRRAFGPQCVKRYTSAIRHIVRVYWPSLEALAAELAARGRMSGGAALTFLEGVAPVKPLDPRYVEVLLDGAVPLNVERCPLIWSQRR